jgi:hypothetical protein
MIEHANQSLRSKSGSLAMFEAMRLASSFVINVAADRRPQHMSRTQTSHATLAAISDYSLR